MVNVTKNRYLDKKNFYYCQEYLFWYKMHIFSSMTVNLEKVNTPSNPTDLNTCINYND